MRIILLTVVFALFMVSCENDESTKEAELITYSELLNQAGFEWFPTRYQEYQVNDSLITLISENYNSEEHEFVMFVKPSCGCEGTQEIFPAIVKILDEAGIDSEKYTFYAMGDEDFNHPYIESIDINDLPTCVTLKNGIPVYSMLDSLAFIEAREQDTVLLEHPILYSLQK